MCAARWAWILGYGDTYVVPEDNAHWGAVGKPLPQCRFVDLQVFPSQEDAWGYLHSVSCEHSVEVITLEDIEALARTVPLYIAINVEESNAADIAAWAEASPIAGLSFTLSEVEIGSYHTYIPERLEAALAGLTARGLPA